MTSSGSLPERSSALSDLHAVSDSHPAQQAEDFIRRNTRLLTPPLVPEIVLHLAEESVPIWEKTEEELGAMGLPPPYWAFAWAGGQALARYVLDNPQLVRGRMVLDLAAGSGLDAIAAAKAGAASVTANDIDAFALTAITLNAAANSVVVLTDGADLLSSPPPVADVFLVGDLFYEKPLAERALGWLRQAAQSGCLVLVGDPGRSYFPKDVFSPLATYSVPVTRELEDSTIKQTTVWRLPG
jgi:predicted nicotinamide N-methyase